MDLPKIKSAIIKDLSRLKILTYGTPKVGKSSFWAQSEYTIFVATEPGHNFLQIFKVDIKTWAEFKDFAKTMTTTKHEYKTIVIDTVDNLYKMCEQAVLEQHKVLHASDLPFGKGFSLVKDEFAKVITYLGNSGFGMAFISHAKEKELKTKTSSWTIMTTSLPNQAEGFICGMCDFIFYCYINEKGERLMKTRAEKYVNAGSRGLDLPSPMPLDYSALVNEFNKNKPKETTI